jgi:hypothetical protein
MIDKIKTLYGGMMATALIIATSPVFAHSIDAAQTSGQNLGLQQASGTLGEMMNRIIGGTANLPDFISIISTLIGILFVTLGIYKLKNHTEFGQQSVPLADPLKLLFAGALMMTLPTVASVVATTFGGVGAEQDIGWDDSASGAGGLDGMLVNFMSNIYGPMVNLMVFFCYVAGAALMLIAVHRFTKTAQEGPRGPTGLGTIATFVLAGVLFSVAPSVGTLTETLFGGRNSMTSVEFLALSDTMGEGSAHAENVVMSVLAFLIIVGILSIIRGFFVLRGVAEGNQQMTMMGGVSHVIAGAILVNFGKFANIIQNTLGIGGYGVLFN